VAAHPVQHLGDGRGVLHGGVGPLGDEIVPPADKVEVTVQVGARDLVGHGAAALLGEDQHVAQVGQPGLVDSLSHKKK